MRVWRRFGPLLAIVLVLTPLLALAPIPLPPDGGMQEADAAPHMKLPWDRSENGQWTMTQGPHRPSGLPMTSGLDFARGYNNPSRVLSMFEGKVTRVGYRDQHLCPAPGNSVVEVTSDDGTVKVEYIHITNFDHLNVGSRVRQGTQLGLTGKVGCTTGVHVHLELYVGGKRTSWEGRTIDGWRVGSSLKPNSSNVKVEAGPSCPSRPLEVVEPLVIKPTPLAAGQTATASFAVKNVAPSGCPTYNAVWIGAGGRGPNSAITDFPLKHNVKIAPGQVWRYKESKSFSPAGKYTWVIYVQDLQVTNPRGLTQRIELTLSNACPDRPLKVTTPLSIDNRNVNLGDQATASFTVTNTAPAGCKAATFKWLGAGGRGPGGDPDVQDFPLKQNVTIAPGESYTYTASRRFTKPGTHSYWAAVQDQKNSWYTVAASNTVTVSVADCAPLPVVASNIELSPPMPVVGDAVTASYTIRNDGCAPFAPESIGVAARSLDNQELNYDFGPWVEGVVLQPGESRTITVSRTFDDPGPYRVWVSYRDADLNWINNLPTADDSISNGKDLTIGVSDGSPPASMATTEPTGTAVATETIAPAETAVATETIAPAETAVASETAAPEPPPAVETISPETPPAGGDPVADPTGIERCVTDPEAVPLLRAIDPTPDGLITTDELRGLAATLGSAELQALADQAVAEGGAGYRYDGACNVAVGGEVSVTAGTSVETPPPAADVPPTEMPEPEDALTVAVSQSIPSGASAADGTVDRDGVVCLVLEEGAAAAIATVDSDGDGTISLQEARAVAPDNVELQRAVDAAAARGITGFRYQGCGAPAVAATVTATATMAPEAASAPEASAPSPSGGEEVAVISGSDGDAVNCRAAASVESAVIARLPEGTAVALNGPAEGGWQPVLCDGQTGYVATAYLATPSSPVTTTASATDDEAEPVAIQPVDGSMPVDAPEPPAPTASASGDAASPSVPQAQVVTGDQPGANATEEPAVAEAGQPVPLTVAGVTDSEQSPSATHAIDGDSATVWVVVPHLSPKQVELTLDLGQPQPVGRLELELASGVMLPPVEMWLSMDGSTWWSVASFDPTLATAGSDEPHSISLGYTARFVRLVMPDADRSGLPEVGGIVEVVVWPADGPVTALEALGPPVTPVPEPVGTEPASPDATELEATETPLDDSQVETVPIDDEGQVPDEGDDVPQVIEAEPAG